MGNEVDDDGGSTGDNVDDDGDDDNDDGNKAAGCDNEDDCDGGQWAMKSMMIVTA